MAVAVVRAGAAWRVICSDMAASSASVRCAVEPTRKVQQADVPRRSSAAAGLSVSRSSGDGAQLRCQAATLTVVREVATAEGVLERKVEMRSIEESRAVLRDSFEAASVSGRVECVGTEECRPTLEDAGSVSMASAETTVDMVAAACEQRLVYHGRRGGGDAYLGLATMKPADMADGEREAAQMEQVKMVASFEAALPEAGRNAEMLCQLAIWAWHKLGDSDRAEQLYMVALQLAPEDNAVQASYAQFLWQCNV